MIHLRTNPNFMMNEKLIPTTFNSLINELFAQQEQNPEFNYYPKATVVEKTQSFELKMALPGTAKENIQIKIDGEKLVISGENNKQTIQEGEKLLINEISAGKFERSFKLGKIDKNAIDAELNNGILTLSLPKLKEDLPLMVNIK